MTKTNPYLKPVTPRDSLELLRWAVMEPNRVRTYEESLPGKKEQILVFLKAYVLFCLFFFFFWLLALWGIAFFDLPGLFTAPEEVFEEDFWNNWVLLEGTGEKFQFLTGYYWIGLAFGLAVGLAVGLAGGLTFGLAEGLAGGLVLGLGLGLALGLAGGLARGLTEGLALGLAFGLALGLALGLAEGLALGLAGGLAGGLALGLALGSTEGLAFGLVGGLAFSPTFYFFYFRIPFWLLYQLTGLIGLGFRQNFYLKDQVVWLPVWGVRTKLARLAKDDPEEAERFIGFLLRHRPLQRKLALHLIHVVAATRLKRVSWSVTLPSPPPQLEDQPKLSPSDAWLEAWERLEEAYVQFRQQTNFKFQLENYREVVGALEAFEKVNLTANPRWNHYYFDSIEKVLAEARVKLAQLQQEAEPIVSNPYQVGGSLEPGRHRATFLDREDLQNKLKSIIRTTEEMPLFLIQGQRRVGKTSLLKFLPGELGPGFRMIFLDLQSARHPDIPGWLTNIRSDVNQSFGIEEEEPWSAGEDWLRSWSELSAYLLEVAKERKTKILIAFDEYEALQEKGFAAEPEKAGQLLGAIRSYTQHQKQVVLLFAGAHYFFELENPNWGTYFVHSQPMEVKYLSREKTLQLTRPTDDFPIRYEDEVPERIYELTRGHPALAQEICYYLVDIANAENRSVLTGADLDRVLEQRILVEGNHPMSRFWQDFCREEVMKATVRQVIRKERPGDKASLQKLLRHGFVLKTEEGYALCNPLFERYIRRFDLEFFEV